MDAPSRLDARASGSSRAATSTPPAARFKVVAYDSGIKLEHPAPAALGRLRGDGGAGLGRRPRPCSSTSRDGVFLSNGPGDPEGVPYLVESVRGARSGRVPIFGICLGHQILGLAAGGRTYKLPFGHHGANHPVRDLATGRVEITSQNHDFAVDPASVAAAGWEPTPRQPERRHVRRAAASRAAGLLRAVPPGGLAGSARRELPVPALHRPHGAHGGT